MQIAHKSYKLLTAGTSGYGKTTYWERFILNAEYDYRFIFDCEGEFSFRHNWPACTDLEGIQAQLGTGWVVFDPVEFDGELIDAFNWFCDLVFEMAKDLPGKKLFCSDELQDLADPNSVSKPFSRLMEKGRRRGLDAAFVAHQLNLLHNRTRNQFTEIVSFNQQDKKSIEWLEYFRFNGNDLQGLQEGEFVLRTKKGYEARGRIELGVKK